MKKILLLFLFVLGCEQKNRLDELEKKLYQLKDVYVLINQNEMNQLGINKNDYKDYIALKTLVVYERKEIFVFYDGNESLKEKLIQMKKENMEYIEMNNYIYYGINDESVIKLVEDTLNK